MNTWHKQDHKNKNQDVKLKSEADREPKQKLWKIHKNIAAASINWSNKKTDNDQ